MRQRDRRQRRPGLALVQADFTAHGLPLTRHDPDADGIGTTAGALFLRARAKGNTSQYDRVPDLHTRPDGRLAEDVTETAIVVKDSPTGARAACIHSLGYAAPGPNRTLDGEDVTLFQPMTDLPGLPGLRPFPFAKYPGGEAARPLGGGAPLSRRRPCRRDTGSRPRRSVRSPPAPDAASWVTSPRQHVTLPRTEANHDLPPPPRPVASGTHQLINPVLMGSTHTGLEETGDWNRVAEFYATRARRGVGLIVTGGMAPNAEGGVFPGAAGLYSPKDIANHRIVTDRVHDSGGRIAMQILHAGRYAYSADCVAPLQLKSPVSPFPPMKLDEDGIEKQIVDIVTAAARAVEAGYEGVEIMGSEGYFLNQFLVTQTNRRTDCWGGAITPTECACRWRWSGGSAPPSAPTRS